MPRLYFESIFILGATIICTSLLFAFSISNDQVKEKERTGEAKMTRYQDFLLNVVTVSFWYAIGLSAYVVFEGIVKWLD